MDGERWWRGDFIFYVKKMVTICFCFFFNDTATTEIYTLSLHDALPIFLEQIECLKIRDDLVSGGLSRETAVFLGGGLVDRRIAIENIEIGRAHV